MLSAWDLDGSGRVSLEEHYFRVFADAAGDGALTPAEYAASLYPAGGFAAHDLNGDGAVTFLERKFVAAAHLGIDLGLSAVTPARPIREADHATGPYTRGRSRDRATYERPITRQGPIREADRATEPHTRGRSRDRAAIRGQEREGRIGHLGIDLGLSAVRSRSRAASARCGAGGATGPRRGEEREGRRGPREEEGNVRAGEGRGNGT